jgi:hypothetical protein
MWQKKNGVNRKGKYQFIAMSAKAMGANQVLFLFRNEKE